MSDTKACTKCGLSKSLDNFNRAKTGRDGRRGDCRSCRTKANRQRLGLDASRKEAQRSAVNRYRATPRGKAIAQKVYLARKGRRAAKSQSVNIEFRNRKYSFDFESVWLAQDGKCRICDCNMQKAGRAKDSAVVDHCHSSNRVRGLLCNKCNRGLGLFNDSSLRMTRAAAYLDSFARAT